jgi:hypothetical protein
MSIMNVLFIPLAWVVSAYTQNIIWFMGVMCFCVAPGLVVNILQFSKILKGNAKGIWIA